jgi:hypothetical protein
MGNKTSNSQSKINYEDIPTAEAVLLDIPIASAYSIDEKLPSAPPMPSNEEDPRKKFIEDKNNLLGKYAPEPSAPPMPTENLPFRNQYKIHSDDCSQTGIDRHPKNYFDNSSERALREGIDRTYVALVRCVLESGELDKIEILTRELDYLNERISRSKHNKRRLQIKEILEERMKIALK